MVGKEKIIEIYLSCLISVCEISIRTVYGVECEAGQIHRYEVEVHALNARS